MTVHVRRSCMHAYYHVILDPIRTDLLVVTVHVSKFCMHSTVGYALFEKVFEYKKPVTPLTP